MNKITRTLDITTLSKDGETFELVGSENLQKKLKEGYTIMGIRSVKASMSMEEFYKAAETVQEVK